MRGCLKDFLSALAGIVIVIGLISAMFVALTAMMALVIHFTK